MSRQLIKFVVFLFLVVLILSSSIVYRPTPLSAGGGQPPITLSLLPSSKIVQPGEAFSLDVFLDMQTSSHTISFVSVIWSFDPSLIDATAMTLEGGLSSIEELPPTSGVGRIGFTARTPLLESSLKIATLTFRTLGSSGSSITIHWDKGEALSVSANDTATENVVGTVNDATICVGSCEPVPTPTYFISGRVNDSNGNPMSAVTVSIAGLTSETTTTDTSGDFTFGDLAAGTYTITPSKSGYTFSPSSQAVAMPPSATAIQFTGMASGQPPAAPSSPHAAAVSTSQILVNWQDNADDEAGFKIDNGTGVVATVGANTSSTIIGGLAPNSYSCYAIYAYNEFGSSSWTDWACTTTVTIPALPIASFDSTPFIGIAPLVVTMHNTSIGNYTNCVWDYGDGQRSTSCDSSHTHTYTRVGTYTVTLTASGPGGSNTKIRSNYISVIDAPLPIDYFTWKVRAPMPTARTVFGIAKADTGKIYVIGGFNGGPLATVEEYDPATDTWRTRASMPTARASLGATTATNGKIYAIGGWGTDYGDIATVEEYDPATDTWRSRTSMPTARDGLAVTAASNGKIYAIGGNDYSDPVEEYDPATDTWRSRTSMPTPRRGVRAVAMSDGEIYALGGVNNSGVVSTVEVYDSKTDTWSSRTPMPTARAWIGVTAASNGKIYAIGGELDYQTKLDTVEEYDPTMDTWTPRPSMPTARGSLGVVATNDGKIYAIGGASGGSGSPVVFHSTVEEATVNRDPTDAFLNCAAKIAEGILAIAEVYCELDKRCKAAFAAADLAARIVGCATDKSTDQGQCLREQCIRWAASQFIGNLPLNRAQEVLKFLPDLLMEIYGNDPPACVELVDFIGIWLNEAIRQGLPVNGVITESPVYPLVINQTGQRTGFLSNGQVVDEIPNSQAIQIGEKRVVLYPEKETVTVEVIGYDMGTMTLTTIFAQSAGKGMSASYKNVPVTKGMKATVNSVDIHHALKIDTNNDGTIDQDRLPDTITFSPSEYPIYLPSIRK